MVNEFTGHLELCLTNQALMLHKCSSASSCTFNGNNILSFVYNANISVSIATEYIINTRMAEKCNFKLQY